MRSKDESAEHIDTDSSDVGEDQSGASRRQFIGMAGAGAGLIVAPGLLNRLGTAEAAELGDERPRPPGRPDRPPGPGPDQPDGATRFSRMFRNTESFARANDETRSALIELARPGGILDANDPLEVGPVRLITEPELSPGNPDNPNHTAGTTFFGQFLDHDITRDAGSRLGRPTSLRRSVNLRTTRFDLDSVYGGGPLEDRELYRRDRVRLRVESGGRFEDLPREAGGMAIMGDGRNDENVIVAGLHAAFLMFHNAVARRVQASGLFGPDAFAEAQRLVRWHYQWMILHEFLPQVVGQSVVNNVLNGGRRFYRPDRPQIPVEFQTAAYRFGHSMVRPSYRANMAGDGGEPFFGFVFDPSQFGRPDPDDLTGGVRAPRRYIGWQTFFDFDDGEVKPNKKIDTAISTPLFRLPASAIGAPRGEPLGPTSLATRNLLRHLTWEVPSGQDIARRMGVDRLSRGDLADFGRFGARLDQSTPMWLYVLREAELMEDGLQLGPMGGRIVAEVFIGLLQMDPTSYLRREPNWRPTLPTRAGDRDFRMADMLTVAGVDPESRGE